MTTPPDVSICIVNWNGREVLRNCIASLQSIHCEKNFETLIVDNASTDGSAEMVEKDFPQITLIRNLDNRGFAAGNNQAAAKSTGNYLFFLNNDTVLPPESINTLVRFLDEHPDACAVGPKLIGSDGKPQRSARNLPTLRALLHSGVLPIRWTLIFSQAYRAYRHGFDPDKSGPVPQLAAAALLVRRGTYHAMGGWDESFDFGVEDVDFCLRLSRFGTLYYLAKAWITHLGRVSSHLNRGRVYRSYQCGYVSYFRKHHRSPLAPLIYKIAITFDTPIRLTLLLAKMAISRLFGRTQEAARSSQRAAGVWFFVVHGLVRFWRT